MLTGQTFRVVIIRSLAVAVASFLFSYYPTLHFISFRLVANISYSGEG